MLQVITNSDIVISEDTIPTNNLVTVHSLKIFQRNIYARLLTFSLLSILPAVSPPPGIIQHERTIIIIMNIPYFVLFQNRYLN